MCVDYYRWENNPYLFTVGKLATKGMSAGLVGLHLVVWVILNKCTRPTQWLDESFHQRLVLESIVTSSSLNKTRCNVYLINRIRIDMKHVKEVKNRLYRLLDSSQIENQFIIKLKHWRSHWYDVWCHEFRWIHTDQLDLSDQIISLLRDRRIEISLSDQHY
jgi:hypothetical protein